MRKTAIKPLFIFLLSTTPLFCLSQSTPQQATITTIPFKEWSMKFQSLDIKGKFLNVNYVVALNTSDKKSLQEEIEVFYTSNHPEKISKATWYRWNPLDKCWSKFATPGIEKKNGSIVYKLFVKHPGTYALMHPQNTASKGINIKAPRGYYIESISIRQENPAIAMDIHPKKPERTVHVPLTEPQFDSKIQIKLSSRKGGQFVFTKKIIGEKIDWSANTSSQESLKLAIGREEITEFDSEVVLIGN